MIETLLSYTPFFTISLIAQWSDRERIVRWITYGLILLLDLLLLSIGLVSIVAGQSPAFIERLSEQFPGASSLGFTGFGLIVITTALLSPIPLLRPARDTLAKLIPIDPESGIHATALSLAVLAVGLNVSQVPLIGGLRSLADLEMPFNFFSLIVSNIPIILFAFVGVGFVIRRSPEETWKRLGIGPISLKDAGFVVLLTIFILVFYYGIDWIWRIVAPENYELMSQVGEIVYGGATAAWQGILLSVVAALTEEFFFRGALQPRFGFLLTALIFTSIHVQYGISPALLEVFGAALALGWLRRRSNTTACILLHALYNMGAFLIFPLLP